MIRKKKLTDQEKEDPQIKLYCVTHYFTKMILMPYNDAIATVHAILRIIQQNKPVDQNLAKEVQPIIAPRQEKPTQAATPNALEQIVENTKDTSTEKQSLQKRAAHAIAAAYKYIFTRKFAITLGCLAALTCAGAYGYYQFKTKIPTFVQLKSMIQSRIAKYRFQSA